VTLGLPVTASLSVELDRLDLDAYMPQPSDRVPFRRPATAATATTPTAHAATLGLKAKVAKLVYRGRDPERRRGRRALRGNVLKLNNLQVADLLGAKLGLKGTVTIFAAKPPLRCQFQCQRARYRQGAALSPPADLPERQDRRGVGDRRRRRHDGCLYPARCRGEFPGCLRRASGTVKVGDAFAFDFPNVALQSGDISRLVTVASGRSMNGLAPCPPPAASRAPRRKPCSPVSSLPAVRR